VWTDEYNEIAKPRSHTVSGRDRLAANVSGLIMKPLFPPEAMAASAKGEGRRTATESEVTPPSGKDLPRKDRGAAARPATGRTAGGSDFAKPSSHTVSDRDGRENTVWEGIDQLVSQPEDSTDSAKGEGRRAATESEVTPPSGKDLPRKDRGAAARPATGQTAGGSDFAEQSTGTQEDGSEKVFPIRWTSTELDRKPRFLIEGVIDQKTVIIVHGPPGEGKSLIVLDICIHIAIEHGWMGRRTTGGRVVYITSESQEQAVNNRRLAFEGKYPDLASAPFGTLVHEFDMMTANDRRNDPEKLIHTLRDKGPITLIVFDTMSATMGGASDTSQAAAQRYFDACTRIGKALECAVMIVHHSGKDPSKGPRGSNAISAAIDTELLVADGSVRSGKQRDMGSFSFHRHFTLEKVELGEDEDGNMITGFVPVQVEEPSLESEMKLPKSQQMVMKELHRLSIVKAMSPEEAAMEANELLCIGMDADTRIVRLEELHATRSLRNMKTSTRNDAILSLHRGKRIGLLRTSVKGQRSAGFVWMKDFP